MTVIDCGHYDCELCSEARELARRSREWVRVEDGLPDPLPDGRPRTVLVHAGRGAWAQMLTAWWEPGAPGAWYEAQGELGAVTHWRPLPEPPQVAP